MFCKEEMLLVISDVISIYEICLEMQVMLRFVI